MKVSKQVVRSVALLGALALLVGLAPWGVPAAAAEEMAQSSTAPATTAVGDADYAAYVAAHGDTPAATAEAVYALEGAVLEKEAVSFPLAVPESAYYYVGLSYRAPQRQMSGVTLGLRVDGAYPYEAASALEFPRMWTNEDGEVHRDDLGNEFVAQQVPYTEYFYNESVDESIQCGEKYRVYLTAGTHTVTLEPKEDAIQLEYFRFAPAATPAAYTAPTDTAQYYTGDTVVLEGEDAAVKSSYYLVGKNDGASVAVTPQSADRNRINYIGGGNWKTVGETLVWETPELPAGYYQLGFSFRQGSNIGGKSYRTLTVDGEIPFAEAAQVGFPYGEDWQKQFFAADDGTPYLVYLSAGKHRIGLSVTAADMAQVRTLLTQAVSQLGTLYVDMTKITGETVDIYRDYDLFTQIADMEERLQTIAARLQESGEALQQVTGETSGSKYAVILNMRNTVEQMLNHRYEAHRYKDTYYSNYCSVSSVLQELREMPLDLDRITLNPVGAEEPFESSGFFRQLAFSARRFAVSFSKDYNTVAGGDGDGQSITIWVSWGRDQAQVLNSLIKRSFEPQSHVQVNLRLANATVIQAILSGNGPDCFLQMVRSEPVNLALRGVLRNLSEFEDCDEVLTRFMPGADTPYRFNGGLYALPDTQNFYMMFYRKDILAEYGLSVPTTWEELNLVAKLLMRNNMTVYLPITAATDVAQANLGVGSNNIFPSLLLQNGVPLYAEDGKKTNLLSAEAMEIFGQWTNYYTKLKFPKTLDFYNRFRTGTTPLGISSYTLFNTIKAAAPEIEGLWGVTAIPGTVQSDDTLSHAVSGGGTGCVILKSSANPSGAWEFLKWWTSADTQMSYSNDLESVLGPTGRVAVANTEAFRQLSWSREEQASILDAWQNVQELPEYPGSYYVSRSIYQAYWNVVNSNKNSKDMLMRFGKEADDEIDRKWKQYANR